MTKYAFHIKIIIFFTYLITSHVSIFASSKFTLYFPLAWEIESNNQMSLDNFSSAKLEFYSNATGKSSTYPFNRKDFISDSSKKEVVFLSPKTITLSPGEYDTLSLSVTYKGNNVLTYKKDLKFSITNGKVTPLGGLLIKSKLEDDGSKLASTDQIQLNQYSIDYADMTKSISTLEPSDLNSSNQSSPRIINPLPKVSKEKSGLYGIEVRMPCKYDGMVTFSYKKENSPIDYYSELHIKREKCFIGESLYREAFKFRLAPGNWVPVNMGHIPTNQLKPLGFNLASRKPLKTYFDLDKSKFFRNNAFAKNLDKNLNFVVSSGSLKKSFLYLGSFRLNFSEKTNEVKSVIFSREFVIRDIRKVFKETQAYNAYTNERITHSKILGTISVLFHKINTKGWGTEAEAEVQKTAINKITDCVHKSEAANPLFEANGSILIRHIKNDTSHKQYEFKFSNSNKSVQEFRSCLMAQFNPSSPVILADEFLIDAEIFGL